MTKVKKDKGTKDDLQNTTQIEQNNLHKHSGG